MNLTAVTLEWLKSHPGTLFTWSGVGTSSKPFLMFTHVVIGFVIENVPNKMWLQSSRFDGETNAKWFVYTKDFYKTKCLLRDLL